MNNVTDKMFESGVFERRYNHIIEIYPRRAMNSELFDAALRELSKNHDIIKITPGYLRAFEMGVIE